VRIFSRGDPAGADAAAIDRVAAVSAALVAEPEPGARLDAAPNQPEQRLAIVQPPVSRGSSRSARPAAFMLLEEIISAHVSLLFPGSRSGNAPPFVSRATPSSSRR